MDAWMHVRHKSIWNKFYMLGVHRSESCAKVLPLKRVEIRWQHWKKACKRLAHLQCSIDRNMYICLLYNCLYMCVWCVILLQQNYIFMWRQYIYKRASRVMRQKQQNKIEQQRKFKMWTCKCVYVFMLENDIWMEHKCAHTHVNNSEMKFYFFVSDFYDHFPTINYEFYSVVKHKLVFTHYNCFVTLFAFSLLLSLSRSLSLKTFSNDIYIDRTASNANNFRTE